jgi:hypothetical protein
MLHKRGFLSPKSGRRLGATLAWLAAALSSSALFAQPSFSSLSPASASDRAGKTRRFTFVFNDTAGWSDVQNVNIGLGGTSTAGNCMLDYSINYEVGLWTDSGGGFVYGYPDSGAGPATLANSQCTISNYSSWYSSAGNAVNFSAVVTFTAAYASTFSGGALNIYAQARSWSGNTSPWVLAGTYTITTSASGTPLLDIFSTHSGHYYGSTYPPYGVFFQNESDTYTVTVSNLSGSGGAATSGTVTVTESVSPGLTLTGMSGSGWSCSAPTCSRSDALAGGASYPPITVSTYVASNADPFQVNSAAVSGGNSAAGSVFDATEVMTTVNFQTPPTIAFPYPSDGSQSVSTAPALSWLTYGATSCNLDLGTSNTPPRYANGIAAATWGGTYSPGTLSVNTKYYWRVHCSNSYGTVDSPITPWSFTTPPPLSITTSSLPAGYVGSGYSVAVAASGGSGSGYSWSIQSGSLPSGLSLSSGGTISGTPTAAGSPSIAFKVTDSSSNTATKTLTLTVNPALTITTPSLPTGAVGSPYTATLAATGGSGSGYTWSIQSGSLPSGLSLSSGGTISGTPTAAGSPSITF